MTSSYIIYRDKETGEFNTEELVSYQPEHFIVYGNILPGEVLDPQSIIEAVKAGLHGQVLEMLATINVRALHPTGRIVGYVLPGDFIEVRHTTMVEGYSHRWGLIGRIWRKGAEYNPGGEPGRRWIYLRQTRPVPG